VLLGVIYEEMGICYYLLLFILTANGFLPRISGTAKDNVQIAHITQNNTPCSNKTQHAKLHKQ
jgi:hypothetical protein